MRRAPQIAIQILLFAALFAPAAFGQEADCLNCHRQLIEKRYVHPAARTACATCHADLDAGSVPHKVRGKLAKGLQAEAPELCFGCHEKSLFEGRFTHAPAAAGLCMTCHDAHASDHFALGRKAGAVLCLDCHSDVASRPHVLAGFSRRGHALGDDPGKAGAKDPLRPDRPFYCGSCHEPHRANLAQLSRFDSSSFFCQKCHNM